MDLVGWKLEQAREALAQDRSTRALDLRIVETAAPVRRNLNQTLGAWRVLRARLIDESPHKSHDEPQADLSPKKLIVELTVARELLAEERVAS